MEDYMKYHQYLARILHRLYIRLSVGILTHFWL